MYGRLYIVSIFRDEIAQLEKYLHFLLKEKKRGLQIKQKDIGIITPYRKQVQSINY